MKKWLVGRQRSESGKKDMKDCYAVHKKKKESGVKLQNDGWMKWWCELCKIKYKRYNIVQSCLIDWWGWYGFMQGGEREEEGKKSVNASFVQYERMEKECQ